MFLLKLVPDGTRVPFSSYRHVAIGFSVALVIASIALLGLRGLNFGIDFVGGVMIEIATDGPADLGDIRSRLDALDIGDVKVQTFGAPDDVLIRVGESSAHEGADQTVAQAIQDELGDAVEYRRVEVVGPQVSGELITAGVTAILVALALMLVYIWFRFEWQFSLGAILALTHDVILTLGVFALLQMEFNLSTIAAILTIVGYSMNDTVVVFDRMRENLRKYKRMPLAELIDLSINETLSRTVVTALTTLIALFALFFFGGEVIAGFTFAMIFGVIIGTYSSIFVASPVLISLGVKRDWNEAGPEGNASKA